MTDWNSKFETWGKPPSQSEQDRCDNAIAAIKKAISNYDGFKDKDVRVFLQGSYRNNVNVKQNSDVDIGVCCHNTFYPDYPEGMGAEDFGVKPATYLSDDFRQDLHNALALHFGPDHVDNGNKAFDIGQNTYRVEADVAPFMAHRRYHKNKTFAEGVTLLERDGGRGTVNWPEQHYKNGVEKNKATGKKYKQLVRGLKKLSLEMEAEGYASARAIPGFLCECLMWNVPNGKITGKTLYDGLRESIAYLHNTIDNGNHTTWGEVSDLKDLFGPHQKWTDKQTKDFLYEAWHYVGYK
ncbi:MAG: nucleotidyltransferase [Pseudodesulfovibrio sp.]|nr:nucleotidyltransferase [Pseudodesulfovibrio sp.]